MIGYVTLGTNDIDRARRFYDALLGEVGAHRIMDFDGFTAWGVGWDKPGLAVTKPFDGNAATPGNGTMVALVVDERGKVDRIHARRSNSAPRTKARRACAATKDRRLSTPATSGIRTGTSSTCLGSVRQPDPQS